MFKENIIHQLLHEFKKPREEFGGKNYITRRREWFDKPMERVRPFLDKERINNLTINDAKMIYDEMSVGGPKLYPNTFLENGIEKIKKSLDYLLYDEEPLEERFFNFVGNIDSGYYLKGVGRAFASTALLLIDCKNFGIWNGAIDGGLKNLGLLPKRERGEHVGKTYVKILQILEDLREKCEFDDLSVVDEFVELIYHGKIGEGIVLGSVEEIPEEVIGEEKENLHTKIQWMLIKIGIMEGHDVWVAMNDQNRSYKSEKFADLCLKDLPHFAGPDVLRVAHFIDVIWFKKHSAQPAHFFEIEHTTSIYSGLLRLNDVKIDYPIPKATIVAPTERKNLFESQITRRTFVHSDLEEVCRFMDYKDIERLFESEKIRSGMLI